MPKPTFVITVDPETFENVVTRLHKTFEGDLNVNDFIVSEQEVLKLSPHHKPHVKFNMARDYPINTTLHDKRVAAKPDLFRRLRHTKPRSK